MLKAVCVLVAKPSWLLCGPAPTGHAACTALQARLVYSVLRVLPLLPCVCISVSALVSFTYAHRSAVPGQLLLERHGSAQGSSLQSRAADTAANEGRVPGGRDTFAKAAVCFLAQRLAPLSWAADTVLTHLQ